MTKNLVTFFLLGHHVPGYDLLVECHCGSWLMHYLSTAFSGDRLQL